MTETLLDRARSGRHHRYAPATGSALELDRILASGAIRSVYQPMVDLAGGGVVAYEALARGPAGSPLESPGDLFEAARAAGRETELDWACRVAAIEGALLAEYPSTLPLFINVEPAALGSPVPAAAHATFARARGRLRIVFEITERALTTRPADLVAAIAAARAMGWEIALDDVGAEPTSAALMPLLRPDVIKLDLRLIQTRPTAAAATQTSAVIAEAERTGAIILAEGVESAAHERTARALGATIGQGWRYGRPAALPERFDLPTTPLSSLRLRDVAPADSPIDAVFPGRRPLVASKSDLLAFSRHLERWALAVPDGAVVLAALQDVRHLTPATRERYARLARLSPLVALFGAGLPPEPVPGVRGAALPEGDPLLDSWLVVVLGPHFAGALVARDLGDEGPDMERRFEYVVTFDREAVIAAARSLLVRIAPPPAAPPASRAGYRRAGRGRRRRRMDPVRPS
jgi:EAL domain-containing protein (putative c-di-GMP-specific phosphodiesterase class I)